MITTVASATTTVTSTTSTALAPPAPRGRVALEALRSAMAALSADALRPLNVDLSRAVSRALGVAPTLRSLRARIATECPAADLAAIDALEERALAAEYAHAVYLTAPAPLPAVAEVAAAATDARGRLLSLATTLVTWTLLDARTLDHVQTGNGHHQIAGGLITLTAVFRGNWEKLAGSVPFALDRLDEWQELGERLLRLVGERQEQAAIAADAHADRQRAFTLFDLAYNEGRRVIGFLRWYEGDADALMPSIRSHGGSSARRSDEQPEDTDPARNTPVPV